MFLLDTNTLIYYFKGKGNVAERLLGTPPDQLALSTISLFELETGLRKSSNASARRRQLNALTHVLQVWGFDQAAASAAAEVRAALETRGKPIGPMDNLIAGIALAHGATLVSHDLQEFSRVPRLAVVDWYA